MISYLNGNLTNKSNTSVTIDISGMGFEVSLPLSSIEKLPPLDTAVKIFTYMHVREDGISLFGFLSQLDRQIFLLLLKVTGVGPKLGLAALSALSAREIVSAILSEDVDTLTKISGVGPKLAKRLILEIKSNIAKLSVEDVESIADTSEESLQFLLALGFHPERIKAILREIQKTTPLNTTEEITREALRKLTQ
jgi:holliday junction DNA helicase RuvA